MQKKTECRRIGRRQAVRSLLLSALSPRSEILTLWRGGRDTIDIDVIDTPGQGLIKSAHQDQDRNRGHFHKVLTCIYSHALTAPSASERALRNDRASRLLLLLRQ